MFFLSSSNLLRRLFFPVLVVYCFALICFVIQFISSALQIIICLSYVSCDFLSVAPYSPYWILSTDYTTVSVVYSCTNILNIFYIEYAWILGRSRFLLPETVSYAKELLMNEGVQLYRMKATDQRMCKDD